MNHQLNTTPSLLHTLRNSTAAAAGTLLFLTLTLAGAGTLFAYLIISLQNASTSFHIAAPLI